MSILVLGRRNNGVSQEKKKRKEIPNQRVGESKKKRKKFPIKEWEKVKKEEEKGRKGSSWSKKQKKCAERSFWPDNIWAIQNCHQMNKKKITDVNITLILYCRSDKSMNQFTSNNNNNLLFWSRTTITICHILTSLRSIIV